MLEELTTLTPFTMKFLWLLHKSERTQYGSEDVHVFSALAFVIVSPTRLCFTLCILTLSSSARLHEQLNMCATKKIALDGERHANEGWTIMPGVPRHMCTYFDDTFFNALVKD